MSDTSMKNTESWKKLTHEFSMTRNLNADPRLLGGPTTLCPCPQNNSSQRMAMFASNITQAMIPDGAEFPLIASGFERQFMDYTFNTTRLKQNATTVAVIPKYRPNVGKSPISFNPSFVIIYIGESDNMVHYCDVPRYTKGTDGFGYENEINETFLRSGVGIPAETPICHSKAVQGSKYCLGVNANVAYMTMKETVEDAFCMSESLAERMESVGIKTQIINIDKNMVPLNLYGTADDYKFMPDLHEIVREDGILCAFRHVDEASMISDMTDQALMYPNVCHDEVFYTEPGAVIIDIDVYRNPNRQVKTPAHIFTQVDKYIENALSFHLQVIQVYEKECLKNGRKPAPEFASLVDRAVQVLGANKQKYLGLKTTPKFSYKGEVIRYIQLVVTYKYKNKVTKGSKSTGREGSKGVNCIVMPDQDMPINDYGVRADIVIGPEAVFNRMNLGQLYEHFINAMSFFVMKKILETDDVDTQYVTLLEYLTDVNIEFASCVDRVITSPKRKMMYMREVVNTKKIHIVIPPFLSSLTPDWVLEMAKKYNVHSTPVEYNMRDNDGNFIRKVRTLRPIFIAQKYLYILCKIPHSRSCGMAYVNQLNVPIRPKSKKSKSQYPIGLVPIRMGEDENRNLQMAIGPMAFRILSLYANSPEATNKLTHTLLTHPKPTQLTWVDMNEAQLCANNNMIKVAKHMLATCGIDAENVLLTKEEERTINNRIVELGGKQAC